MIIIINICKEPLHYFEFVKPIEDILRANQIKFETEHYSNIGRVEKYDKIIICGTSLKDNEFTKHLNRFSFLKDFKKPVLGICGGAHIIGLLLGRRLKNKKEIGLKKIDIKKEFLGVRGEREVYNLHQLQVLPNTFHRDNFYATLFHPEVRNKEMILGFARL